jgi:energy-coupling factor transporter ATP-binding protein EcfA2
MEQYLGQRLLAGGVVTESQLLAALERQRQQGGRLGLNLLALGFVSEEELAAFFHRAPHPPQTVEETGLDLSFIVDLTLKHVAFLGDFTLPELSARMCLTLPVLEKAIEVLRKKQFVEVKGATQFAKVTWRFTVTDPGKKQAAELIDICRYLGPAPVPFDDYRHMVELQTIKSILISEERVREAFAPLTVSEELLAKIGPAVSSGRAIFLYGPPGNGKTTIAETIGRILPGTIYMPHAILVGGEIVTVFDPVSHVAVEPEIHADGVDQRWVLIRRPVVMVGGEFTLRMLDLDFNPISKFYQGSLQMKANNGLFIVDDFGRQQMNPQDLINRWIVPLERRTDFLSLHTGMKFDIPFDQLVIFSTNIEPKKLVDEAFLRRIRYKIKIDHPSLAEYEHIFKTICETNGLAFRREVFEHLIDHYYRRLDVDLNACHPRDIVDHIIDVARYRGQPPKLTREAIAAAWGSYFVEM